MSCRRMLAVTSGACCCWPRGRGQWQQQLVVWPAAALYAATDGSRLIRLTVVTLGRMTANDGICLTARLTITDHTDWPTIVTMSSGRTSKPAATAVILHSPCNSVAILWPFNVKSGVKRASNEISIIRHLVTRVLTNGTNDKLSDDVASVGLAGNWQLCAGSSSLRRCRPTDIMNACKLQHLHAQLKLGELT